MKWVDYLMPNKIDRINPWDVATRQMDIAVERLKLDPGVSEKIKQTKRELIVHFPVEMNDGSVKIFTGYRVQHNKARVQGKEGFVTIRMWIWMK